MLQTGGGEGREINALCFPPLRNPFPSGRIDLVPAPSPAASLVSLPTHTPPIIQSHGASVSVSLTELVGHTSVPFPGCALSHEDLPTFPPSLPSPWEAPAPSSRPGFGISLCGTPCWLPCSRWVPSPCSHAPLSSCSCLASITLHCDHWFSSPLPLLDCKFLEGRNCVSFIHSFI